MNRYETMMFFMLLLFATTITATSADQNCTELTEDIIYREFGANQTRCFQIFLGSHGKELLLEADGPVNMNARFIYCDEISEQFNFSDPINFQRKNYFIVEDLKCPNTSYVVIQLHNPNNKTVKLWITNQYKRQPLYKSVLVFFIFIGFIITFFCCILEYCETKPVHRPAFSGIRIHAGQITDY